MYYQKSYNSVNLRLGFQMIEITSPKDIINLYKLDKLKKEISHAKNIAGNNLYYKNWNWYLNKTLTLECSCIDAPQQYKKQNGPYLEIKQLQKESVV